MADVKITRKLDDTGRVVIPKDVRESLNWESYDTIEVSIEEDRVVLKKKELACLECGTQLGLVLLGGHMFCRKCLKKGAESY